MAQIVTITNPLTGQPAQVDQLEHTAQQIDDAIGRALPGGEIDSLLSGKAPAGYGLGGIAKILTSSDDLNNIKTTGWYCYHRSKQPANVPTPEVYSAVMEVIFGNFSGQTVQRVYSTGDNKDWNLVAQRVSYGSGGWQPWEWLNPPMILGVEYRTTERYQEYPVYYQRISYGNTLPASGFTQRVVSTLPIATTNILDIDVTVKNGTTYEVQKLPCISDSGVVLSVANAIQYNNYDNYCIRVRVFSDMSAWSIQKIVVKYTKTTD